MFFMNASVIIFGLFFLLIILTAFYVWRRINGLESYNKILEKKVNHLKKDNKELREILYGNGEEETCNVTNDADIIMNKIFNADILCVSPAPSQAHHVQEKENTTKITCNDDICELQDTSDIVQNIIADSIETEVAKPKPMAAVVVETVVVQSEQDNDMESVISDAVNGGAYNRKKLTKMNLDKLKEVCVSMHLPTEGTKNVLIDKILSNLTIE